MAEPTLSASEFAVVTGMTRDRLRTWERRYGWPDPERVEAGPRRYRTQDASRVVAVRRLHELGMPIESAISRQTVPLAAALSTDTWQTIVDGLPLPLVVLSGPQPLVVEHVNVTLRERPGAPAVGTTVEQLAPWFAGEPADDLRAAFGSELRMSRCAHPDWAGDADHVAHSLAVRVPQAAGSRPLVAVVTLDAGATRQARDERGRHRRERREMQASSTHLEGWCAATREVATLSARPGTRHLRTALHAVQRSADAADAALLLVDGEQSAMIASARGLFGQPGPAAADQVRLAEVSRHVWIPPGPAAASGAPAGHGLTLAGAALPARRRGVLALASTEPLELPAAARELLESCAHLCARAVSPPAG